MKGWRTDIYFEADNPDDATDKWNEMWKEMKKRDEVYSTRLQYSQEWLKQDPERKKDVNIAVALVFFWVFAPIIGATLGWAIGGDDMARIGCALGFAVSIGALLLFLPGSRF